jgi:hypothetical protein
METETCPYCEQPIPLDEWDRHEKGRDRKRMDCPHQDLEKIKVDQEPVTWATSGQLPDRW